MHPCHSAIAIIENEFWEIGIDSELVINADEESLRKERLHLLHHPRLT